MSKRYVLCVSILLSSVLGADDFDFIKSFSLDQLHKLESNSSERKVEYVEDMDKWDKCCLLSKDYLMNSFDKCHTKTPEDLLVAGRLKQIVSKLYDYELRVGYNEYFQNNKGGVKVHPFRSPMVHFVNSALKEENELISSKIRDFCNVWAAVEVEIEDDDSACAFEEDKIEGFTFVCDGIARKGGFKAEFEPFSLKEFAPVLKATMPVEGEIGRRRGEVLRRIPNFEEVVGSREMMKKDGSQESSRLKKYLKWVLAGSAPAIIAVLGMKVYKKFRELSKDCDEDEGRLKFLMQAVKDVCVNCYGGSWGWLKERLGFGGGLENKEEGVEDTEDPETGDLEIEVIEEEPPSPRSSRVPKGRIEGRRPGEKDKGFFGNFIHNSGKNFMSGVVDEVKERSGLKKLKKYYNSGCNKIKEGWREGRERVKRVEKFEEEHGKARLRDLPGFIGNRVWGYFFPKEHEQEEGENLV